MANPFTNKVILNKYRVTEFIAAGGMGAVYKVYDLTKNVYLAMKVLNLDVEDDPSSVKHFKREANAYRKLSHPNIVPFYGLEQTDDMLFMLQKFVDGDSLKGILARQKGKALPVPETLAVMKALCASLGYAHYNGVVHCDVKPGNVLVDQGGNIFLTDFGIARHAESTTTSMAEAGTVAYMAPEQIRGETVTPETDIYELGVVLFELLTGQRPFRGKESDSGRQASVREKIRTAHLTESPPDPRSLQPGIPEAAALVVLKALAKDMEKRFETTQVLFSALCAAYQTSPEAVPDRISPALVQAARPGQEYGPGQPEGDSHPQERADSGEPPPIPPRPIRRMPAWLFVVIGLAIVSAIVLPMLVNDSNGGAGGLPGSEVEATGPVAVPTLGGGGGTDDPTQSAPTQPPPTMAPEVPTEVPTAAPTSPPQPGETKMGPNGMTLVYIPAGEFLMGSKSSDPYMEDKTFINELPQHPVKIDGFWIGQTEVTNQMYSEFVDSYPYITTAERTGFGSVVPMDAAGQDPIPGVDWLHPRGPATIQQGNNYPVVQLSWYDAKAYCEWAGGRLPTEAEWEKAARGEDGRQYPWGNSPVRGDLTNFSDSSLASSYWMPDASINDGYGFLAPVGSYPKGASPYGVLDMAGNVWEWVADWYQEDFYSSSSAVVNNPKGPSNGTYKVLRGGCFVNGKMNIRTTKRRSQTPYESLDVYGLRCVFP